MSAAAASQAVPLPAAREAWTPRHDGHLPVLDGIRGLAILLVMLYHMNLLEPGEGPLLDRLWSRVVERGSVGVDLFFVLSGFLITGILYDARESAHFFRNFYARRTVRIFPLYYAVVFFSLVILPYIPNAKAERFGQIAGSEVWYWTYLSNFSIAYHKAFRHGILDVSWSLAIEEQFYLLWPAAVFLLDRKRLMWLCAALIPLALLTRIALILSGSHWIPVAILTPCRIDTLAVGAFIALATRAPRPLRVDAAADSPAGIAALRPAAVWIAAIAGAVALVLYARELNYSDPWVPTLGYTAMAVFFGALLVLTLNAPPGTRLHRAFANRALCLLGKYSYALYLFHLPLRAVVRDKVYGLDRFWTLAGSKLPGQILFCIMGIALTLAAALVSWHLYEKQFLKLKKFFPSGNPKSSPAT